MDGMEGMEGLTQGQTAALVYVSDFLRRNLETHYYNERPYCVSKENITKEELVQMMRSEVGFLLRNS